VRGSEQQPKAGIGGAIRRLFRQAVKAVTGRKADAPRPKKAGRRGTGEDGAGRLFYRVAQRLTRSRVRPAYPAASALLWLADTLDWLDLWHPAGSIDPANDASQEAINNDLSPRL
jgi:hypothetical protein